MSYEDDGREVVGNNGSGGAETIIERLRQRRMEMGQDRTTFFDIPGFSGELVVEYGVLPWEEVSKIVKKVGKNKNPRADLYGQADILIRACRQIYLRVEGELRPLDPQEPIRFDERLAQQLGFEATTARQSLFETFQNDLAVSTQHGELMQWIQRSNDEEDESFVGESERTAD